MSRYLLNSSNKASTNREQYFVELGLFDFWSLAMRYIKNEFPPFIEIRGIDDAFRILKSFIAECGNIICMDFADFNNADHITGVETDNTTMRLIWYSVDEAYKKNKGEFLTESMIEMNQQIYGENLELQSAFTFNYLILTPSYILLYAKERDIPMEMSNDMEMIKINRNFKEYKIYDHIWGDYNHEPILQFRTTYYCDAKLVAVLHPKGSSDGFCAENLFDEKV
jgi:hypothetical protein